MPYGVEKFVRKEEILVTSNFSFSHIVFHRYISLVCQNVALCGNGLRCRITFNCYQKSLTNTSDLYFAFFFFLVVRLFVFESTINCDCFLILSLSGTSASLSPLSSSSEIEKYKKWVSNYSLSISPQSGMKIGT